MANTKLKTAATVNKASKPRTKLRAGGRLERKESSEGGLLEETDDKCWLEERLEDEPEAEPV